jgi:hypothetical protein
VKDVSCARLLRTRLIIVGLNTMNDNDQSSHYNKNVVPRSDHCWHRMTRVESSGSLQAPWTTDLLKRGGRRAQHASTRGRGILKDVRGRSENAQTLRWLHRRPGVSRCAGKLGPLDGPSAHAAARPSATPAAVVSSAVDRLA